MLEDLLSPYGLGLATIVEVQRAQQPRQLVLLQLQPGQVMLLLLHQ